MLYSYGNRMKLFRAACVALLAGTAWLMTANAVLGQSQPSDAALQASVTSAVGQDSMLTGQHISATVDKGVVTLTGTVQTPAQSEQAETDAANVSGVSGIVNQLTVTNPGTTTPAAGLAAQTSANQLSASGQTSTPTTSPTSDQAATSGQYPDASQNVTVPPPPPDTQQNSQQAQQQQYGQQQGYRQNYNPQQGYSSEPQQIPYYATPTSPVTVPVGTLLRARLSEPLDTAHLKNGAYFQATAANDVYENGVLAIPRGATITGQVVEAKDGGRLGGSAILRLALTSVNLGGKIYPLTTDVWSSKGANKAGYTATNTGGGALFGALLGGLLGGGGGAALGAGVGAIGGLAASGASNGPRIYLPTETAVDFHLTNASTVQPVPWQEAERLAMSAPQPQQQPVLVRRPRPVYVVPAPYYGPYPYGYGYPYPYY